MTINVTDGRLGGRHPLKSGAEHQTRSLMTDLGTIVLTHQPPLQRKGNLNGAREQKTRPE
ncbi:MAG: Uncharacterised protein [Synechococcus sp. MIT S9220]|nr:MAG: Uncharacterised protein [Synechococcus sp. MIT S9220]